MTQTVNVPGVGQLQFPDGMSQAAMSAAIKKNFPQVHAAATAKAEPRSSALKGLAIEAARPIAGAAADIVGFVPSIAETLANASHLPGSDIPDTTQYLHGIIDKYLPAPKGMHKGLETASEMVLGAMAGGGSDAEVAASRAADAARAASHAVGYVEKKLGLRWQQLSPELKKAMLTVAQNPKDLEKLDPAKVAQEIRTSTPKGQLNDLVQGDLDTLKSKLSPVDQTRGQVGQAVQGTLARQLKKVRGNIDHLYDVARQRGEYETSVDVTPLASWLSKPENARNAGWLRGALMQYARPKEVYSEATPDPALRSLNTRVDTLQPPADVIDTSSLATHHITVNDLENIRAEANAKIFDKGNIASHYAVEAKKVIDGILDKSGGPVFKAARAAHAAYKQEWVRQGIIRRLSSNVAKSSDPRVALENTVQTVIRASAADVAKVRNTLTAGGKRGVAAWNRLQAGAVDYLKDVASKSPNRFLDRLEDLDKDGKLSVLFGPDAAQQMRALAQTVRLSAAEPEGAKKSMGRILRLAQYASRWLPTAGYITGHWPGLVAGHAAESTAKHLIGRATSTAGPVERAAARVTPAVGRQR